MAESVVEWWARRQFSKGTAEPYPVGSYRSDWERYPVLIRQYFPDQNHGIMLTQIPPAAEVFLLWTCEVGHRFVATPQEQRNRPGKERRRSSWCPDCAALAVARSTARRTRVASIEVHLCGHPLDPRRIGALAADRCPLCQRLDSSHMTREQLVARVISTSHASMAAESNPNRRYNWRCERGHGSFAASIDRVLGGRRCRVCVNAAAAADAVPVGDAFVSPWAPAPSSAAEALLRLRLVERFDLDVAPNAVKVSRPFFSHVEVWPDILMPDLRVAIEYDTIGRHGLEHVGKREATDRRKDRLLRAASWEVIRVRVGKLQPLGPFDVHAAGVTTALLDRIEERLREIRGDLIVSAYRR
jgi:hypothetical protein